MRAPLQARNDSDADQTETARTARQEREFVDNGPAAAQRELPEMLNNSPRVLQQRALSDAIHNRPRMVVQRHEMNALFGGAVQPPGEGALPAELSPAQREEKPNHTGLPNPLKSGIESLSGMSMDHVKVHYNSDKPAQLQAHAYAQGSEIHLGAGQERHLPHEAWHVVQQAQGRVRPTLQMKGGVVNDDPSLEKEADMMGDKAAQFQGIRDERNLVPVQRVAGVATPGQRQRPAHSTVGAPVQRMLIDAPALEPEIDPETGQEIIYEDDPIEIDTDLAQLAHVPDMPPQRVDYLLKKLRLAWNRHYQFDPFAQNAIGAMQAHLRRNNPAHGYGVTQRAQRATISLTYNQLVNPNPAHVTGSFQEMIQAKFGARVAEVVNYDALYSAQITALNTELTALAASKLLNDRNTQAGKSAFYTSMAGTGAAPHQVPNQNRTVTGTQKTHGAYTVGATTEVWVSVHGATGGQDVAGWGPTSDLNYKYGLVHAPTKKLVGGHLLPAWLGGRATDENLTPITNEANGWLAANAERAAKRIVFSNGSCLKYEVACTFGLAVAPPIEGDVAALVPSTFTVTLTPLRWTQAGDPTDWARYATHGAATPYAVPGPTLGLNYVTMGTGVQRGDLNRTLLSAGMA